MYYAMYDFTARKSNPGYGFSNSKKALAFTTRQERDAFLAERASYDFSARAITRKETMKYLDSVYGRHDRGLQVGSTDGPYYVMRESVFGQYKHGQTV